MGQNKAKQGKKCVNTNNAANIPQGEFFTRLDDDI